MFGKSTTPTTLTAVVQQGMDAIAAKQDTLTARRDTALSAFRNAANELAVVNTGLSEVANTAAEMADFFEAERQNASQAIADNEAVRQKILAIIGA